MPEAVIKDGSPAPIAAGSLLLAAVLPVLAFVGLTPILPQIEAHFHAQSSASFIARLLVSVIGPTVMVGAFACRSARRPLRRAPDRDMGGHDLRAVRMRGVCTRQSLCDPRQPHCCRAGVGPPCQRGGGDPGAGILREPARPVEYRPSTGAAARAPELTPGPGASYQNRASRLTPRTRPRSQELLMTPRLVRSRPLICG